MDEVQYLSLLNWARSLAPYEDKTAFLAWLTQAVKDAQQMGAEA